METRRVSDLLALPVTHNGIELGRPLDALVDVEARRTLGLEVRCRDDNTRFLPLGAARLGAETTEVGSPLALLDDIAFYRARGTPFRELRGSEVAQAGVAVGSLADLCLQPDGALASALVETASGRVRLPLGPKVSLRSERQASAA